MNTKYIGKTLSDYLSDVIPKTDIFKGFGVGRVEWYFFYMKSQREICVAVDFFGENITLKDIQVIVPVPDDYVVCGTCLELHPSFSAIDMWSVFGKFLMCVKCKKTKGVEE